MDYSQYKQLEFRRKFFKFFGAEIHVTDPTTNAEVGFIKMKAWKLREDVRLYTNQSMQQEVLQIHARQVIDFGATYDVIDSSTNQPLFSMRRKGMKSTFVRDHWLLLDGNGNEFGSVQETSSQLAIMRRWFGIVPYIGQIVELAFAFVPQTYDITVAANGAQPALAAHIVHRKNPFVVKMLLDTSAAQVSLDPRIGIASAALLSVIDAAKNS